MDEKPVSGAAKKVRGSITEALGKLTGDKKTEKKGAVQKKQAEAEISQHEKASFPSRKKPLPQR